MIRLLISLVTVGVVVSCYVEDNEASEALVTNHKVTDEVVVPDWITIGDVDLNRDKRIDFTDVEIVSKFLGEIVPDDEHAKNIEEPLPSACQAIKGGNDPSLTYVKESRNPNNLESAVLDNTDLKETFGAPDGGKYVYALMVLADYLGRFRPLRGTPEFLYRMENAPEYRYSICVAVRFYVDDSVLVRKVKMKPVAWFDSKSKGFASIVKSVTDTITNTTITSPYLEVSAGFTGGEKTSSSWTTTDIEDSEGKWNVEVMSDWDLHPLYPVRLPKVCIPIGDSNRAVCKLSYAFKGSHPDRVAREDMGEERPNYVLWDMAIFDGRYFSVTHGAYLDMKPAKVRSKYFPEDIQE